MQIPVISTGTVTLAVATPKKTGLFANNPIISSYDFSKNERIPQKVVAELNFFVTKLMKVIDVKAGDNSKKKNSYNQQVAKYILDRAKKTTNQQEKRILAYIYKRFSIVTKIPVP